MDSLLIIKLVILAIVQGVAEFLPISSSGHLAVIDEILDHFANFDLDNLLDSLTVSVILHLGTLASVLVFYWRTLLNIVVKLRFKLAFLLILASIPAAAAGFLLHDFFEDAMDNLAIIGSMFIATALLLLISQRFSTDSDGEASSNQGNVPSNQGNVPSNQGNAPNSTVDSVQAIDSADALVEELSEISWTQALIIGVFQMFAILPGLSRSGSTIAGGLFTGLKQSVAANFSFLMAIPVIGGAGLLEALKLFKRHASIPVSELAVGFLLSFIVGLFALYWVINWIKRGKLSWFAYWLFFMAIVAFSLALFK